VLPPLSYLERFRKQLEENRLRSALDPVEEAHVILQTKVLLDIGRAEALLTEAGIGFVPLESRRIDNREEFQRHLELVQPEGSSYLAALAFARFPTPPAGLPFPGGDAVVPGACTAAASGARPDLVVTPGKPGGVAIGGHIVAADADRGRIDLRAVVG
jgi:hypothetical protein